MARQPHGTRVPREVQGRSTRPFSVQPGALETSLWAWPPFGQNQVAMSADSVGQDTGWGSATQVPADFPVGGWAGGVGQAKTLTPISAQDRG